MESAMSRELRSQCLSLLRLCRLYPNASVLGAFYNRKTFPRKCFSHPPESGALWGGVAGWIIYIPVSMFAIKKALEKNLASLVATASHQAT